MLADRPAAASKPSYLLLPDAKAKKTHGQARWALWFLLPAAVLFGGFVLLPIIIAVVLSFSSWNGSGAVHYIGLNNWDRLLHDSSVAAALERTGLIVLFSWLLQEPIAIALGIFAASRARYRAVLTTIYFIPMFISAAATGVLWSQLLAPYGGGVQYAAVHFHLGFLNHEWLASPHLVLGTVIVLVAWEFIPFHTLLYQAAASQIPRSLYEAAMLDGVGPWTRLRYITLPMLRNSIVTSSTLNVVGSLTVFDLIYTLTGGGPGQSTTVLALDQYLVGFKSFEFGYASSIAILLGVTGVAASLILIRVTGFGRMRSQAEGA
jgi:ABC-type sugar transport system permease subunit